MTALTTDQVLAHDIRTRFGPVPETAPARADWVQRVALFLDAHPIPAPTAGETYEIRDHGPGLAIGPDPDAALERWVFRFAGVIVTGREQTGTYRSVHLGDVLDLAPDMFDRDRGRTDPPVGRMRTTRRPTR